MQQEKAKITHLLEPLMLIFPKKSYLSEIRSVLQVTCGFIQFPPQ